MRDYRWVLRNALSALVLALGIAGLAAGCDSFPAMSLVGVGQDQAGHVVVLWHSCDAKDAVLQVEIAQYKGERRTLLWMIRGRERGAGLHTFQVGSTPAGFTTAVPYEGGLPPHAKLQAEGHEQRTQQLGR